MNNNTQGLFNRKFLKILVFLLPVIILALYYAPISQAPSSLESSNIDNSTTELKSPTLNRLSLKDSRISLHSISEIEKHPTANFKLDIQNWNTPSGASVYFVQSKNLPMVDIQLVFDAGSARDGGYPGLANITNAMLSEGSQRFNVDEIAEVFENIGSHFSTSSHRDMGVVKLRSLTDEKTFNTSLDAFIDILSRPVFPEENFNRLIQQYLMSLEYEKQSPGKLARNEFYRLIYDNHPYGIKSNGTEKSLNEMKIKRLKEFHDEYYVANNLTIAIVGDIDKSEALNIANKISAALPKGKHAENILNVPLAKQQSKHLEYASNQTHIMLGLPGIKRGDKDYFPLYLGNEILGGSGLTSLLSKSLREERGLTYSVYSYFIPMRDQGPFIASMQTKSDQAEQSLSLLKNEIAKFANIGPSEEALHLAKKHVTGNFPLRTASNASVISQIAAIGFYGLPLDYLNTYSNEIMKVSVEDVKNAFEKHLHLDKLTVVTVGPKQETTTAEPESQQSQTKIL